MPKISKVFEIERDRHDKAKQNIIHLFKEGPFYHAYEWSGYLLTQYVYTDTLRMTMPGSKPMTVTHNKIKDSKDTYAFVGFPLRSLEKFIPQDRQISFTPIDDNQIDIAIEIPAEFQDIDYDHMIKAVEEWKTTTPAKMPNEKKDEKTEVADTPRQAMPMPKGAGMLSIVSQIISYPIEKKSPIEAHVFLSEIREQLLKLI